MELLVHGAQVVPVHVCVDLRRGEVRVTQHLLHRPQVRPALEQVRRESVSEGVRRDALRDPRPTRRLPDDAPRPDAGERRAAGVQEQDPPSFTAVEPRADFATRTCPVRLVPETVDYILTDAVIQGAVCDRAVTLGVQTIMAAREVVLLVSGATKRAPLTATLRGPVTPDVPASILQLHPNCIVLADKAAAPG